MYINQELATEYSKKAALGLMGVSHEAQKDLIEPDKSVQDLIEGQGWGLNEAVEHISEIMGPDSIQHIFE